MLLDCPGFVSCRHCVVFRQFLEVLRLGDDIIVDGHFQELVPHRGLLDSHSRRWRKVLP